MVGLRINTGSIARKASTQLDVRYNEDRIDDRSESGYSPVERRDTSGGPTSASKTPKYLIHKLPPSLPIPNSQSSPSTSSPSASSIFNPLTKVKSKTRTNDRSCRSNSFSDFLLSPSKSKLTDDSAKTPKVPPKDNFMPSHDHTRFDPAEMADPYPAFVSKKSSPRSLISSGSIGKLVRSPSLSDMKEARRSSLDQIPITRPKTPSGRSRRKFAAPTATTRFVDKLGNSPPPTPQRSSSLNAPDLPAPRYYSQAQRPSTAPHVETFNRPSSSSHASSIRHPVLVPPPLPLSRNYQPPTSWQQSIYEKELPDDPRKYNQTWEGEWNMDDTEVRSKLRNLKFR